MPARIFLLIVVAFALSACSLFHRAGKSSPQPDLAATQPSDTQVPATRPAEPMASKMAAYAQAIEASLAQRSAAGGAATQPTRSVNIVRPPVDPSLPDMTWLKAPVQLELGPPQSREGPYPSPKDSAGNRHRRQSPGGDRARERRSVDRAAGHAARASPGRPLRQFRSA